MACDCEVYECLNIAPQIFQCGEDIITTLLSTETGIWLMQYEFNGRWFAEEITVENNIAVSIPNVFNEQYNHKIRFYDGNSALVNDTCYTLDAAQISLASTVTSPATGGSTGNYITVTADDDSDTITLPQIFNVWLIWPGNQAWVRNIDFAQSGNSITLINGSTFTADQQYLMMYL